jgi:hypothetical protein
MEEQLSKPVCRVCRAQPANTAEHFIPQAVGNRGLVNLHVLQQDGTTAVKRCTNGYYEHVLCSKCNSDPCSVYAQAYARLCKAVSRAAGVSTLDNRVSVPLSGFHGQRFVKHLVSMFLCVSPWEPAEEWNDLQAYVMDRSAPLPPSSPRVFLYLNTGNVGRVVPFCCMVELSTSRHVCFVEVSWPPLGVVMAYDWHEKFARMFEVTAWGKLGYKDYVDETLLLPRLRIVSGFPLAYGTRREVEAEEAAKLPAYLFHVPPGSMGPTAVGALLEKRGLR